MSNEGHGGDPYLTLGGLSQFYPDPGMTNFSLLSLSFALMKNEIGVVWV
jgi:hypothetical protein